jgi:hypothetical protein
VFRWDCIFLPDSGAFFVNYVITCAFVGTGSELIRVPALLWYGVQLVLSRGPADTHAIQRAVAVEFRFGEEYARLLLMFAMVIMYSISCPLITPFGLLYFLLKHLVDKHNLAFVYAKSKINQKIHQSAINIVVLSVTLLQVFMVGLSIIRSYNGKVTELTTQTVVSLLLLIPALMVFAVGACSGLCRWLSPIQFINKHYAEYTGEENFDYRPEVMVQPVSRR